MSDGNPGRYLIVAEDSHLYRTLLGQLLERMNFKTIGCEDGAQALAALRANRDKNIVGIVSDIYMPNMTGMELLEVVRLDPELQHLPFIIVTAESEQEMSVVAILAGANEYLIKPISSDQLFEKMRKVFPETKMI